MKIGKISKVGIGLAAYEPNPHFFYEQLRSIQDQNFQDWICMITCDSPMAEMLREPSFSKIKEDNRFIFFQNSMRLGHKKNFQRSLEELMKTNCDAIAFSDQDDVWYPNKLQVCVKELEQLPAFSLVHSDMHILTDRGVGTETAWSIERRGVHNVQAHHLLIRNVVAGCSVLMDTRLVRRFPVIPEGAEFHDHWYALAAATLGKINSISIPLYAYRQHTNNVVAISPFRGRFWIKRGTGLPQLFKKMMAGFEKSRSLAWSAREQGLQLNGISEDLVLQNWDLGLGFFLLGLRHFFSDPALARACFARGGGKFFKSTEVKKSPATTQRVKQKSSLR